MEMRSFDRYGVTKLKAALEPLVTNGLKAILIFGVPTKMQKVHSCVCGVCVCVYVCVCVVCVCVCVCV